MPSTITVSTLNIQTPGIFTLVVDSIPIIPPVNDLGTVTNLIPSPALIPASASVPEIPPMPPELSPVVHCIPS